MRSRFYINPNDLDEVYPPITPFSSMSPEQVEILRRRLDSSILVSGGPCSGKTVLAIGLAKRFSDEGKKCLYVARTSLLQSYAKEGASFLGLRDLKCISFFEATKDNTPYDVIIVDDSEWYSLEEIKSLVSLAQYVFLLGNYTRSFLWRKAASIPDISAIIPGCRVYSLNIQMGVPFEFIRLIPRNTGFINHKSTGRLPVIAKVGSIKDQCASIKTIVDAMGFDNVGILCYTQELVASVRLIFDQLEMPVEVYHGRIVDVDWNSTKPMIMTIASSSGIHFNTVFVVGFDADIVDISQDVCLETAVTRARENLYIFYEKQLPQSLAIIPQAYYRSLNNYSIEL